MEEISNKTLATLLVVAIVISLAGTFFAMRGTSVISKTITGYASTDVGEAKVNITQTISITLNADNTVDFGEGYRNQSDTVGATETLNCNLTSSDVKPTCWYNVSDYAPRDFLLENDGNVNVNVTINSSLATTFLDGTKSAAALDATYEYKGTNYTQGTDLGGCEIALISTLTAFDNTRQDLCEKMLSADNFEGSGNAADKINITIKLGVPHGMTGYYNETVDFLAEVVYT